MSLINDALKRAKDAQKKTPAVAPGPELRPAEPLPPAARGVGMVWPMTVILFVFVSCFFIFEMREKVSASQPKAEIVSTATAAPAPKPPAMIAAAPKPPVVARPAAPAVAAPVVVPDPGPKLQAVFFAPGHSTAIISGKTVRAGDSIKGFRVAAIGQNSATLTSRTQTNVMTLEQ
jgi:hypothetical protein